MSLPASDYVSLSLVEQDSSSCSTSGPSIHVPKKGPPPTHLKREFLFRISAFSVLELGFIVFASIAGRNPVVLHLPSNPTLTEAKGTFTVIFILWHTLAATAVNGIIFHIFSAEWAEQYRASGDLVPGETDIVSRITSGYPEQIKHFMSKKATLSFRIGFISTLLLVFLNALGPSTISVSSITLHRPSTTRVANLTKTWSGDLSVPWESERANIITRLEYLQDTSYGFTTNGSNILIPWPSPSPASTQGVVTYESDVIIYNFSCLWNRPTMLQSSGYVIADNLSWFAGNAFEGDLTRIIPMLTDLDGHNNSLSAFLFVWGNNTVYMPDHTISPSLGSGSPTEGGFAMPATKGDVVIESVLICDPHMWLAPATVTISGGFRLEATPRSGPPIVKNISPDAANVIFSESLNVAMSSSDSPASSTFNSISYLLFVGDNFTGGAEGQFKILSVDKINENMNKMLLSSAKAYLSGSRLPQPAYLTTQLFTTMNTTATIEVQVLALTASRPFLTVLLVVLGILVIFVGFLIIGGRVKGLQTFDLENVVRTLNSKIG